MYDTIQKSVDSAREEGADICILLAHLGVISEDGPYTSMNVIANTTGIDAVLDGHSHSVIESESVKNKDGKRVAYSQTGTKLEYIGCLTIAAGGMTTKLVSDYEKKDADFDAFAEDITGELNERLSEKIGETEFDLLISDENGNWIIRNGETNLGNLVVDSYRYAMGTEAAFVNSGNIRTEIFAGDITWNDIYSVLPYFNELTVVEVTGQQIADLLEFGAHAEPEQFGGFMQVSGISYTIDMSIPSGVKTDEKGMMTGIEGERRVKDILVNGEPLDPERLYTVSGNRYALLGHGDGHTAFDGANELPHDYVEDSTALRNFLVEELGGVVPDEYSERYGTDRITLLS